ncbi:MAG: hypothetical protein AB7L09_03210 [Nitrospira sp.]
MKRSIDPRHLMSAQEVVASTLSGIDVSVEFDAVTPYADLTNRVIHLRPVPDQLSDEDVEDIRGDCDHELGHIIHTDPQALEGIKRKLVLKIASAIEDGRVERLVAAEWLGCGENLERSAARAIGRILENRSDDEVNRRARALCGLSLMAYGRDIEYVVSSLGGDIAPYYAGIDVQSLLQCRNTTDVEKLATEIADLWKWKPVGAVSVKSSQAKENAAARELDAFSISPSEVRKELVTSISAGSTKGAYHAKTDGDRVDQIRRPSFPISSLFGLFFDGVRKTAPILRRRLMMQFMSTGERWRRHQRKGRLDERSLWRSGVDDDRIYKTKRYAKTNRSIVTILVDCSSSMTRAAREPEYDDEPLVLRTRLFVAAQAAAAVSLTLDHLGVPNEVLAFTTARRNPKPDSAFDRVRALRHIVVKPFNRPARSCRTNFISLAFYEHCSENIDGEALMWAARRMLSKPKRGDRPVLMVFSDGEPASSPENRAILAQHLRTSIKNVEDSGITVFGIGVGSESVQNYYDNYVVVHSVTNLLSVFYDLLKKVLQERETTRV